MKAEIEEKLKLEVQLIEGGGGIFDVRLDGALVYSKGSVGRFPDPGEIPKILAEKAA